MHLRGRNKNRLRGTGRAGHGPAEGRPGRLGRREPEGGFDHAFRPGDALAQLNLSGATVGLAGPV